MLKRSAPIVGLYLAAITAANLITTHYAGIGHPEVSVYTAFGLVAFDLVARDRLHDLWGDRRWLGILALVVSGSLISYLLNRGSGQIALASTVAFASALTVDSLVYEAGHRLGLSWLERSNISNLFAAAVDSVVFVAIAFPGFLFAVAFGQFTAKVAGGLLFSVYWARRYATN